MSIGQDVEPLTLLTRSDNIPLFILPPPSFLHPRIAPSIISGRTGVQSATPAYIQFNVHRYLSPPTPHPRLAHTLPLDFPTFWPRALCNLQKACSSRPQCLTLFCKLQTDRYLDIHCACGQTMLTFQVTAIPLAVLLRVGRSALPQDVPGEHWNQPLPMLAHEVDAL